MKSSAAFFAVWSVFCVSSAARCPGFRTCPSLAVRSDCSSATTEPCHDMERQVQRRLGRQAAERKC